MRGAPPPPRLASRPGRDYLITTFSTSSPVSSFNQSQFVLVQPSAHASFLWLQKMCIYLFRDGSDRMPTSQPEPVIYKSSEKHCLYTFYKPLSSFVSGSVNWYSPFVNNSVTQVKGLTNVHTCGCSNNTPEINPKETAPPRKRCHEQRHAWQRELLYGEEQYTHTLPTPTWTHTRIANRPNYAPPLHRASLKPESFEK